MVSETPIVVFFVLLVCVGLAVFTWHLGERARPRRVTMLGMLGMPAGRVSAWEFPDGILCGECGEPIEDGDDYWSVPDGVDGGELVEVLVCIHCAVTL